MKEGKEKYRQPYLSNITLDITWGYIKNMNIYGEYFCGENKDPFLGVMALYMFSVSVFDYRF